MAKVRIVATKEDAEKADKDFGDFVVPKDGWYILTCAEANPGFSKGDDGEPDEDKPRIELVFQITGEGQEERKPEANYGNVWDYITFGENAGWKRAQFAKAFGFSDTGELDDDIETDECINVKVLARLKQQKGRTKEDPPRAKVVKLLPYGYEGRTDAITDGSNVEYGGDDPFGGEDEQGGENDPYTVDELEAMDLKELGAILKDDFGTDPQTLIVKTKGKLDLDKTKEAVVNAILEAQGAGDEGSAEEDPF